MPARERPRDGNQFAKLVVDMATVEAPNDKGELLAPESDPVGRAASARARAAARRRSVGARRPRKLSRHAGRRRLAVIHLQQKNCEFTFAST